MALVSLPLNGLAFSNEDIAKHLEELACWIREDQMGDVRNAYLLVETVDGVLTRHTCGQPCDLARAAGILTIAAFRAATGE